MTVTQHPTLAARDAYAARGGWIAERHVTSITYHSEFGLVARSIVTPEMLLPVRFDCLLRASALTSPLRLTHPVRAAELRLGLHLVEPVADRGRAFQLFPGHDDRRPAAKMRALDAGLRPGSVGVEVMMLHASLWKRCGNGCGNCYLINSIEAMVPGVGIEPTLLAERDFESVLSSISGAVCRPILSTKNALSGSSVS